MSDQLYTIEGWQRETTGKTACRRIRKNGRIPANLIGKGKSTLLEINPKLLSRAYKGSGEFNLSLDGNVRKVRIKEVHIDHLRREPLHVDLMDA